MIKLLKEAKFKLESFLLNYELQTLIRLYRESYLIYTKTMFELSFTIRLIIYIFLTACN